MVVVGSGLRALRLMMMEVEIRLANVGLPDWEWCVKENQELQTLNYYVRIAPSLDKITHAYTCATDIFELAIFWPLRRHLQRILLTSKLVSTVRLRNISRIKDLFSPLHDSRSLRLPERFRQPIPSMTVSI